MGRKPGEPFPVPGRDGSPDPPTSRRGLPADLPYLGARSGRRRADRRGDRRARPRGGRCGRRYPVVGYRMARGAGADDRQGGSARRLGPLRCPPQARRRHSDGGLQPYQHARDRGGDSRRRRRRSRRPRAAPPRRSGIRRQGGVRAGRPDQHLHRVQPGLPRPDLPLRHGHPWSTPKPATNTATAPPLPTGSSGSRSPAPDRPASPRRCRRPSAVTR